MSSLDGFVTNNTDITFTSIFMKENSVDGFVSGKYNISVAFSPYNPAARVLHNEVGRFSTLFWYDNVGRLVLSQNTKQFNRSPKRSYSYTLYDALGIITEVGEKYENDDTASVRFRNLIGDYVGGRYNPKVMNATKLCKWIKHTTGKRLEVTSTYYDSKVYAVRSILPATFAQENLRKRVVAVTYQDTLHTDTTLYNHASYYNYDIHGNVKNLLAHNRSTKLPSDQKFKLTNYTYDLVSGKVNEVHYQYGQPDAMHHHYEYDSDNRLTAVFTSRYPNVYWNNDQTHPLWSMDAKYFYYPHGPLARVEVGNDKVQGIDYAYTLQGWIKGINSNNLAAKSDIGKDGLSTPDDLTNNNPNNIFAKDAASYSLDYYTADYRSITTPATVTERAFPSINGTGLKDKRLNLYNGNITSMVTSIKDTNNVTKPLGQAYKYDQLNRLLLARAFNNFDTAANTWSTASLAYSNMYYNKFEYDSAGNITKQVLRDEGGTYLDSLVYRYEYQAGKKITNRLYNVNDLVSTTAYTGDMENEVSWSGGAVRTSNNYKYDELGNLTADSLEEIRTIKWTVYGKIKSITHKPTSTKNNLIFEYDASGNRTAKHIYTKTGVNIKSTYYVRDAQGNVLTAYALTNDTIHERTTFVPEEFNIFGSSRVGILQDTIDLVSPVSHSGFVTGDGDTTWYYLFDPHLGAKQYEITNHLGNVLTTFTDKKLPVDDGTYVDGVKTSSTHDGKIDYYHTLRTSATDYMAFGAPMKGRTFHLDAYRYGFNGKENDNDVKGDGIQQDYGMRIYDPRLGRFLSADPLIVHGQEYPELSSYQFASNTPIFAIDKDGLEGVYKDNAVFDAILSTYIDVQLFLHRAHAQGMHNVEIAEAARQAAVAQGRADGDGINGTVKAFVYLGPFWNGAAPISDANDGAVLMNGKNLDGTKATSADYGFASAGLLIPFVSGGALKNLIIKPITSKFGDAGAKELKNFFKVNAGESMDVIKKRLQSSIDTHAKEISKHKGYIANPKSKYKDWDSFTDARKQNEIHHWEQDIERHEAYKDTKTQALGQLK